MSKRKIRHSNRQFWYLAIISLGLLSMSIFLTLAYRNPYKDELFEAIGYSSTEIEFISTLDHAEKDNVLNKARIENIIKHYTIEYYSELANLNYSDTEIDEILRLDNSTISFVLNHPHIENLLTWLANENFIIDNYDRYIEHLKQNPDTQIDTLIEQVNTYRDYPYYSMILETNTEFNELMLVNKYYALDASYVPKNLVTIAPYGEVRLEKMAAEAFIKLCADAENEGFIIRGISGYRSYQTQENLYKRYLQNDPQWLVDTYSARPGHSEHQTGLAIDVSDGNLSILQFESTSSFTWMTTNAHLYGFILRYQKGKQEITGYKYEPWHYRYVGIEVATFLYETRMTYDEYFAVYIDK